MQGKRIAALLAPSVTVSDLSSVPIGKKDVYSTNRKRNLAAKVSREMKGKRTSLFTVPADVDSTLEGLVACGRYSSRSHAMSAAVRAMSPDVEVQLDERTRGAINYLENEWQLSGDLEVIRLSVLYLEAQTRADLVGDEINVGV
jgi:Arc/MetJ-type ribon-helix-helix transcriptional regulator